MAVVAAAVVHARDAADVGTRSFLDDGQRIHVGTQADRAPARSLRQDADDTRAGDSFVHCEPELRVFESDHKGTPEPQFLFSLGRDERAAQALVKGSSATPRDFLGVPCGHAAHAWRALERYCPGVIPHRFLKCRDRWLWS